jgi:hypothetical protein
MRAFTGLAVLTAALLGTTAATASDEPTGAGKQAQAVGSDRDDHGCIPSAGYRWCAKVHECVRPWELAKEQGLDPTPEAFEEYCRDE